MFFTIFCDKIDYFLYTLYVEANVYLRGAWYRIFL